MIHIFAARVYSCRLGSVITRNPARYHEKVSHESKGKGGPPNCGALIIKSLLRIVLMLYLQKTLQIVFFAHK